MPEAVLLEISGAGTRASSDQFLGCTGALPCIPTPGASPTQRRTCPRPCPVRPHLSPLISLQPQKSRAEALGQKVQALEKTVTSRERRVTEAAQTLQATAQALLHQVEPLLQVGSGP